MAIATSLFSSVLRHWPFANGAGRAIDRFGKSLDLGTGLRQVETPDGFSMSVLADDLIGRHLLLSGQFDKSIIRVLIDFAEDGDQCLDVGANIGYVSCLLLSAIKNSTVVSVEPQPKVFELLQANLSQFPESRWQSINVGLSDVAGEGFMMLDSANHGAGRLVEDASTASLRIPLLPADKVIGALPRLDIMKMDVEGFEETIFRDGAKALERLQPRAILFEDALGKAAPDGAIGSLLEAMGYAIFSIDKQLLRTGLVPLKAGDQPKSNDYLALSRRRNLPAKAVAQYGVKFFKE